jgi:hypothetical protein
MSDNLRQITSKNNEKDFLLFLYQHRDSVGIVHCNSKLPDVLQGGVCDNAKTIKDGQ